MPSLEQMRMVGESCTEYDAISSEVERSCASCSHWDGEEEMCALDIFLEQLTNLDQT
ncbi:MAG: hypothetical protein GX205_11435 [Firmicutes bacterium]|nr:hypothetical protein [Bacillota bacterium]